MDNNSPDKGSVLRECLGACQTAEDKRQLQERVKELTCLQRVSEACRTEEHLDRVFREAADVLSVAFLYPDITCARIFWGGKSWQSRNFRETQWRLSADLMDRGKAVGSIDVFYLEARPAKDEGPFLHEERNLLDQVAYTLGREISYKQTVAASRERDELLQRTLTLVPDLMSIHDADMNIVYSNWNGIGAVPEDKRVLQTKCHKTYRGHDHKCPDCFSSVVLETRKPAHAQKQLPDGRWVDVRVLPMLDDKGDVELYLELVRDITERKQAEEELKRAKEAADAANRAKFDFLASMSHEIRTPMNGLLGFADLLRFTNLDDKQKKYASTIMDSGKTLLGIVDKILDLSKVEAGKIELEIIRTDVRKLIGQAADLLRLSAKKKGVSLRVSIDSAVPRFVMVDPLRLRQVFSNLLTNALKFTEEGEVVISAVLMEKTGSRGSVKFSVRDTGIGISVEQQRKLFKAFSQADASTTRKYGGTGLGLVISERLVQLMGSHISVESEPGRGAEFSFCIEMDFAEDAKFAGKAGDHAGELTFARNARILIADDDPVSVSVASEILALLLPSVEIIRASNGKEALDKVIQFRPDLAFIDVAMPLMDGNEATVRLREYERRENMPRSVVVGLTAKGLESEKEHSLQSGMDDYLTKPIDQNVIRGVLAKYVV